MNIKYFVVASLSVMMFSTTVSAQLSSGLQREVDQLREDVMVLQRQTYRDKSGNAMPTATASNVQVRLGEMDELIREVIGKVDQLEFKLKKFDERLNMINKDIDVRLKMIEGKPIDGGMGSEAKIPEKYSAPVAKEAPKSIVGEGIQGGDLKPLPSQDVNAMYQEGLDALKASNNVLAEDRFSMILSKFPKDKLAGNAQYWLGEVYYGKKEFPKAAVAFAKGYENYKGGPKGADSLLKLGMSMRELGKKDEACVAFTSLPKEFPKAPEPLLVRAKAEVAKLSCK